MALPAGVFVLRGGWHTFVLARGAAFRELFKSGAYVELRPVDRMEATDALVRAAGLGVHDTSATAATRSGFRLRSFSRPAMSHVAVSARSR